MVLNYCCPIMNQSDHEGSVLILDTRTERLDQTAGCTAEAEEEEAKGGQMEIEGRRKKGQKKRAGTTAHTNKEKKKRLDLVGLLRGNKKVTTIGQKLTIKKVFATLAGKEEKEWLGKQKEVVEEEEEERV